MILIYFSSAGYVIGEKHTTAVSAWERKKKTLICNGGQMETPSLIYLVLDAHVDEFKTCDARIAHTALLFALKRSCVSSRTGSV